jgi:hypothetical protein
MEAQVLSQKPNLARIVLGRKGLNIQHIFLAIFTPPCISKIEFKTFTLVLIQRPFDFA